MDRREYLRSRRSFQPEVGEIYENEGGGRFECMRSYSDHSARMRNVASDWAFLARFGTEEEAISFCQYVVEKG